MQQAAAVAPPGPSSLVPGRVAWTFGKDPLAFLAAAASRYGDVSRFKLGDVEVFFVCRAEYVWDVLVTQRARFEISTMRRRLEVALGTGLLTSRGELHARQRKLMLPVFRKSRIEAYAGIMLEFAERMRDRWRPGETIDVTAEMMRLAIQVVARTLFSHDIKDDSDVVSRNVSIMMSYYTRLMSPLLQLLLKLPLPSTRRFWKASRDLDAVIYRIIEHRRRNPSSSEDLLALLMQAKDDETNVFMTEKQLRDELLTLLVAGHETTANALGWTIYLLAQNPEADARLHAEISAALAGRPRLEAADLERLHYTRQVLLEGMRLYPPAWFTGRTALEDVPVGGFRIPKGATVLVSQFVMHRDARYFEDPARFRPERWSAEFQEKLPRGSYFPFGGGDRHCVGENFAWQELLLILGSLVQRWRFELVPGQDIRPSPSITLRPSAPIRAIVRPRHAG